MDKNALADTYAPDFRKMYESALGTIKDTTQQNRDSLNQQISSLPYQYQQQRNQTAALGVQTARAMDETNAQRGIYNSGTARTDLARNSAATQTGINDINNQQNQAVQALRNQLNQLGSQEATAIAGIQGQEGQDARNYQLQMGQLMGNVNGTPTLAANQYQQNLGLQQAALTGQYNGAPTLAGQAQNADLKNQGYSNKLALLQALQNYNLGIGQVTDTLPQFEGYNYGDTLKQLLASLGTAS